MASKKTVNKEVTETKVTAKAQETSVVEQNINPPADVYSKEMLTETTKRAKVIKAELGKVENSFSKIAFNLHWIHENGTYKALGYKNVYDFAKMEFGIARGTCNNFINVVERFGKRVNGEIVEQIEDCYKEFKSSQLILMLDLSDKEIEQLDIGMSVRDMKKKIKEITAPDEDKETAPEETKEKEEVIDVESKEVNMQVMITITSKEDYDAQEDKIYDMICRALKDPKHKVEIAYTW